MPDFTEVNAFMRAVEQSEKTVLRRTDGLKTGLDLGTAYIVLVALDEENRPVACEKQAADVLRDGVVVDYLGALAIVKRLKERLENRLERSLENCAIAMPAGTESSAMTHKYVAEGAGFTVTGILDEPSAANSVYGIRDGVVVDIGGGTTGIAVFQDGHVIKIADEPTGGVHLSLVLAGNRKIPLEQAEALKLDARNHREILPLVRPVIEKMAAIVCKHIAGCAVREIYLCGGTCCLNGIDGIFEHETGLPVFKADNPFLVTPAGIAMNCL